MQGPRHSGAFVGGYVAKYMDLLEIDGEPPIVKVRSNMGAGWLGRSTWSPSSPRTSLLELLPRSFRD